MRRKNIGGGDPYRMKGQLALMGLLAGGTVLARLDLCFGQRVAIAWLKSELEDRMGHYIVTCC